MNYFSAFNDTLYNKCETAGTKRYNEIYTEVDFLSLLFNRFFEINSEYNSILRADQKLFMDKISILYDLMLEELVKLEVDVDVDDNPVYQYLIGHHKKCQELFLNNASISEIYYNFLKPFGDNLSVCENEPFYKKLLFCSSKAVVQQVQIMGKANDFINGLLGTEEKSEKFPDGIIGIQKETEQSIINLKFYQEQLELNLNGNPSVIFNGPQTTNK